MDVVRFGGPTNHTVNAAPSADGNTISIIMSGWVVGNHRSRQIRHHGRRSVGGGGSETTYTAAATVVDDGEGSPLLLLVLLVLLGMLVVVVLLTDGHGQERRLDASAKEVIHNVEMDMHQCLRL